MREIWKNIDVFVFLKVDISCPKFDIKKKDFAEEYPKTLVKESIFFLF